MILDAAGRFSNEQQLSGGSAFSDLTLDLGKSPDHGIGEEFIITVKVDSYTAGGGHTGTQIGVVVGDQANLSGTNVTIGGLRTITVVELEARDDDADYQSLVIRVNPMMQEDSGWDVTGVARRYLGLQYTNIGGNPVDLKVTAYLGKDPQTPHAHMNQDVGMIVN